MVKCLYIETPIKTIKNKLNINKSVIGWLCSIIDTKYITLFVCKVLLRVILSMKHVEVGETLVFYFPRWGHNEKPSPPKKLGTALKIFQIGLYWFNKGFHVLTLAT